MARLPLIFLFGFWLLNMSSQNHWKQLGIASVNSNDIRAIFNDTTSNTLYIGGLFDDFGGKDCFDVARWDGIKWDTLGFGIDSSQIGGGYGINKIFKYKSKLYFVGQFGHAGLKPIRAIATWDGTQWDSIIGQPNGTITDADIYRDTLYISGNFTKIGNINTNFAAKFDGTNWYPMSFPFTDAGGIYHIRAFKSKVYAIGNWYENGFSLTAEYTNGSWTPSFGVQGPSTKSVFGIERIDSLLFFFGRFTHISTMYGPDIVAWSGSKLYSFSGPNPIPNNNYVRNIRQINGKIYAMGIFDNIAGLTNGTQNIGIAQLDNNQWCIDSYGFGNDIYDAVSYHDTLTICGSFWHYSNDSMDLVAKYMEPGFTYSCSAFHLGVEEIKIIDNIKIYPNPATSVLNIADEQNELQNATVEISNNIGQIVLSLIYRPTVDISTLPPGCYLIRIRGKNSIHTSKFIKE